MRHLAPAFRALAASLVALPLLAVAGSPVAPEPYPLSGRYPAELALRSEDDLRALYRLGIDIGDLRTPDGLPPAAAGGLSGAVATVYVTPLEARALAAAGLSAHPVANKSLRAARRYGPGAGSPHDWPSYDEVVARLQAVASARPDITRLVSIGQSVQGRDIWFLKITDHPERAEDEPEFRYSGAIHGDEVVGSEMTLRLAELLASRYDSDPTLAALVDGIEIWLCPVLNPDGYVAVERSNAHGRDLNRSFPDRFSDPHDVPDGREPETQAVMRFCAARRFAMGANLHCGARLLNYPWDAVVPPGGTATRQAGVAPDDELFRELGNGYAERNAMLLKTGLHEGVTRGWEWFQIWGGMQDWAYFWHGEHHVTIELSGESYPPYQEMDTYWDVNRDAMVWWMSRALTGVRGIVRDAASGSPLDAEVRIEGMAAPNSARTDPEVGDYHRLVGAGTYTLVASAPGYRDGAEVVSVSSGMATLQDFALERER
jgi:hypothetical protein